MDTVDTYSVYCHDLHVDTIDLTIQDKSINDIIKDQLLSANIAEMISQEISSLSSMNLQQLYIQGVDVNQIINQHINKLCALKTEYSASLKSLNEQLYDIKIKKAIVDVPKPIELPSTATFDSIKIRNPDLCYVKGERLDRYLTKRIRKESESISTSFIASAIPLISKYVELKLNENLTRVDVSEGVEYSMIAQEQLPATKIQDTSDFVYIDNNDFVSNIQNKTPMKKFKESYNDITSDIKNLKPYNDTPFFNANYDTNYLQETKAQQFYNKLSSVDMVFPRDMAEVDIRVMAFNVEWEDIDLFKDMSFKKDIPKTIQIKGQKPEFSKYKVFTTAPEPPVINNERQEFDLALLNMECNKRLTATAENLKTAIASFVEVQTAWNDYILKKVNDNTESTSALKDEISNIKNTLSAIQMALGLLKSVIITALEVKEIVSASSDALSDVKKAVSDVSKNDTYREKNSMPSSNQIISQSKNDTTSIRLSDLVVSQYGLTGKQSELFRMIRNAIFALDRPIVINRLNYIQFGNRRIVNNTTLQITSGNDIIVEIDDIMKYKNSEVVNIDTLTTSYYNKSEVYTKTQADINYATKSHTHSEFYQKSDTYTKTECNGLYSSSGHNHDDIYYRKAEIYTKGEVNSSISAVRQMPTCSSTDADKMVYCDGSSYSLRAVYNNNVPSVLKNNSHVVCFIEGNDISRMNYLYGSTIYEINALYSKDASNNAYFNAFGSYNTTSKWNEWQSKPAIQYGSSCMYSNSGYYLHNVSYTIYLVFKVVNWGANSNAILFNMFGNTGGNYGEVLEISRSVATSKLQFKVGSDVIFTTANTYDSMSIIVVATTNASRTSHTFTIYDLGSLYCYERLSSSYVGSCNYYASNPVNIGGMYNDQSKCMGNWVLYDCICIEEEHLLNSNEQNSIINYIMGTWNERITINNSVTGITYNNVLLANGSDGLITQSQFNTFNGKQDKITYDLYFQNYNSNIRVNNEIQMQFNGSFIASKDIQLTNAFMNTLCTTNGTTRKDTLELITEHNTLVNTTIPHINSVLSTHDDLISDNTAQILVNISDIGNVATIANNAHIKVDSIINCVDNQIIQKHMRIMALIPSNTPKSYAMPSIPDYYVHHFNYSILYSDTSHIYEIRYADNFRRSNDFTEDVELWIEGDAYNNTQILKVQNLRQDKVFDVFVVLYYLDNPPFIYLS